MALTVTPDFIAGALGGCAGTLAGYPLDTIKVQIQTQDYGGRYRGLLDCLKTISNQSLAKGFYRGLSGPLLSYGFLGSVFFGCYGWAMKIFDHREDPTKPPKYSLIASASLIATVPQVTFSCPIEVVKVILQSQIPHNQGNSSSKTVFKGPVETIVTIVKTHGIRGLYRGFLTQLARDLPSAAIYMATYRGMQYEGRKLLPSAPDLGINFVGGGIAGVLCWTTILPLDVIKSKLQADSSRAKYSGFWNCAKKVYVADGLKTFFSGFIPLCVRAFLVNGVVLMAYSETLSLFQKFTEDKR